MLVYVVRVCIHSNAHCLCVAALQSIMFKEGKEEKKEEEKKHTEKRGRN